MKYAVEHKVSHHEWDVVTVPAEDFFKLFERFFEENDEGESPLETYNFSATFRFENGSMYGDEMWGVRDGKLWTSSHASGVMSWSSDHGQYVSHVHMRGTELGQFVAAEFTLNDALKEALEQIT